MNKDLIAYICLGILLLVVGIVSVFEYNIALLPILIFLGCTLVCMPIDAFKFNWREHFSATSAITYVPTPNEPLFLTRLFLGLSFIARNQGILALEQTKCDKNYLNPLNS